MTSRWPHVWSTKMSRHSKVYSLFWVWQLLPVTLAWKLQQEADCKVTVSLEVSEFQESLNYAESSRTAQAKERGDSHSRPKTYCWMPSSSLKFKLSSLLSKKPLLFMKTKCLGSFFRWTMCAKVTEFWLSQFGLSPFCIQASSLRGLNPQQFVSKRL